MFQIKLLFLMLFLSFSGVASALVVVPMEKTMSGISGKKKSCSLTIEEKKHPYEKVVRYAIKIKGKEIPPRYLRVSDSGEWFSIFSESERYFFFTPPSPEIDSEKASVEVESVSSDKIIINFVKKQVKNYFSVDVTGWAVESYEVILSDNETIFCNSK